MFIKLKDVSIRLDAVTAYGKVTIPQTLQTQELYSIYIWLNGTETPLVATYESVDERDSDYETISHAISHSHK